MAGERDDSTDEADDRKDASHEPRECMPCRGSGQVISNLGGTPAKVTCPWCAGTGMRVPGTDAQAAWLAERARQEAEQAGEQSGGEAGGQAGEPAAPEPAA
ncbi:MAG TPA: hypothetical protein VF380_00110 [Solirubrobacteraceae bacterium]